MPQRPTLRTPTGSDGVLQSSAGTEVIAAVSLAEIQNAAANSKLVGSGSSGSGSPYSELSLGTGLSMSGTTLSVAGSGATNANGAKIDTAETTASTTYTDLATPGPSVTLTTSTAVIIWLYARFNRSTGGNTVFISVDVSGATTIAASDPNGATQVNLSAGGSQLITKVLYLPGLTAGSNTFKLQYRCDGGAAFTFAERNIAVLAL